MLCPICLKNQADSSLVRYFGSESCEAKICKECYQVAVNMTNARFYREFHDKPLHTCRVCKRSLAEILDTLIVGCPFCYKEFSNELNIITKRVQGIDTDENR